MANAAFRPDQRGAIDDPLPIPKRGGAGENVNAEFSRQPRQDFLGLWSMSGDGINRAEIIRAPYCAAKGGEFGPAIFRENQDLCSGLRRLGNPFPLFRLIGAPVLKLRKRVGGGGDAGHQIVLIQNCSSLSVSASSPISFQPREAFSPSTGS